MSTHGQLTQRNVQRDIWVKALSLTIQKVSAKAAFPPSNPIAFLLEATALDVGLVQVRSHASTWKPSEQGFLLS